MKEDHILSRRIELEKLNNTRDLGGMKTKDGGTVKAGRLIRSGHLFHMTDKDKEILSGLVDTVVDLRTPAEAAQRPDTLIEGVSYCHIPILNSFAAGVTHEKEAEEEAMETLVRDEKKAAAKMVGIYQGFTGQDFPVKQYRRFLDKALEKRDKALLWHCTAGKDRAGFGAAILQRLLGIEEEAIYEDYMATNVYLKEEVDMLLRMSHEELEDPDPLYDAGLLCLFEARTEYIKAAGDKARELYGSFEGFIYNGLKVTTDEIDILRDMYLE